MENGLYIQPALAKRMLDDLATQNEAIFTEFQVNLDHFGKYDLTGHRIEDGEACPRTYDPIRQCWSDDWKQFMYESEIKAYDQRYQTLRYKLSDKCPEPKTMMDIVNVAKEDSMLATNAIAEILEQLYH
jgi:hypothetical protein